MKPEVELKQEEMSKVVKVYRRYYRGKWYESETPQPGYDIVSYYATKVRDRLYYSDMYEAQARADKYNARLKAYKKGREQEFPETIDWYDFDNTEFQDETIWTNPDGSWKYAHGWHEWEVKELLKEEMEFKYKEDQHSNVDFFDVLFTTTKFAKYELKKNSKGEWKIYVKNN